MAVRIIQEQLKGGESMFHLGTEYELELEFSSAEHKGDTLKNVGNQTLAGSH